MSFATSVANTWAAILSLTFPRLLAILGAEGAFMLYASLNVLAFFLVYLFVPETRMKTLHELDEVFAVSTRDFIALHALEYPSWLVRRYVLRHEGPSTTGWRAEPRYEPLNQDER